jgi:transcriptional regulator with XRE-family HTH domain
MSSQVETADRTATRQRRRDQHMPLPEAPVRRIPTHPYETTLHGLEVLGYCAGRLRDAREHLGLSRTEVARRLGLHRDTIRGFELAHYWLSMPTVLHYAQIVLVPYVDLFPPDPRALTPVSPDSVEAKILQHLRRWPSEMRAALLDMLEYEHPAPPCPLHNLSQ